MIRTIEEQLHRDEGEVLHAYKDHLGYLTIGIGRLIDKRRGGGLTHEESMYLLKNDVNKRDKALREKLYWYDELDDARRGVLLNMAFQMGIDGLLEFTNTLEMIRKGNYSDAAAGMLHSKWAKQTPERAQRLSIQMRTGEWQ